MNRRIPCTIALLLLTSLAQLGNPAAAASAASISWEVDRQGKLIRLTGQLVESNSGRAISNASIMVQSADLVLAHKETDINGKFVLLIPEGKISDESMTLKIRYREHIFTRGNLRPISQDLQVEINRAVLMESTPVEDYRIPLHDLNNPANGQVLIRTRFSPTQNEVTRLVQI